MCELSSPEIHLPRETDCGIIGSVEPVYSRRRPCRHRCLELTVFGFPGVAGDRMPGKNVQRKLLPTANMILRGPAGILATLYCEIIPQSAKRANRLAAVSAASKCSPPTLSKYTSSPLGAARSKASVKLPVAL